MRPKFPPKPAATSVRTYLPQAIERGRRLRPDEAATRAQVVEDIARRIELPQAVLDRMREEAGDG